MTRVTLRFDFPTGAQLGPGKVRLLELIRDHGSIRAAGAAMNMSYRRAWLLADALNRMFRQTVVETRHGGRSGGGAVLTPFGAELVAAYRRMETDARARLAGDIERLSVSLNPSFEPEKSSGEDD